MTLSFHSRFIYYLTALHKRLHLAIREKVLIALVFKVFGPFIGIFPTFYQPYSPLYSLKRKDTDKSIKTTANSNARFKFKAQQDMPQI